MPSKNYRIRVVKPDFEFEAEGDKTFVLDMLNRFEGPPSQKSKPTSSATEAATKTTRVKSQADDKSLSVGEFVRQIGLKKHTDIVLAFGYYLEKYSGVREFTPADINSCYYDAKMESSNTSQMVIQNIKRGRVMEARKGQGRVKGKKTYVLTRTGEEFIDRKLNRDGT